MKRNILLSADSYKSSHFLQYPDGAEYVSSYIEARGTVDSENMNFVMMLGTQALIQEYLQVPFTRTDLEEARAIYSAHGVPFNYEGFRYILDNHYGFMPVEIQALPEGTIVPLNVPLIQVRNTDPKVPWLTSFIETILVRGIWYPSTVATNSMSIRKMLKAYAKKSATDENVDFKLHDFGARGVSSGESAAIGGFSHLATGAIGTDTVESLAFARRYYDADMAGYSIPAAEHSTITSWGEDGEVDAYRNMIKQFAGTGKIYAVVSDSYNLWDAVGNIWGDELKDEVINSGGTLVVRPDSGDPLTVPIDVIEMLMDKFGFTTNAKGYKVLPDYVRVIQGDGITRESIEQILKNMDEAKLALDNLAFGMGGGMLQQVNRDTLSFAMKANEIVIDGETRDVYKRPMTDRGKSSKAGRQAVVEDQVRGGLTSIRESSALDMNIKNYLEVVYDRGLTIHGVRTNLNEIRARANK